MARRSTIAEKCGLVQVIRLTWTKQTRGGEDACVRNQVPTVLEVPAGELAGVQESLCAEISHWSEDSPATEPSLVRRERVPLAGGYSFGCVTVSPAADGLAVRFQYDQGNAGAPDRWYFNPKSGYGESPGRTVLVRNGQWVRVRDNGRFSNLHTGNWWYQKVTVNVAWFSGQPDGCVFLKHEPVDEIVSLAHLW